MAEFHATLRQHRLSRSELDSLAGSGGDPGVIETLRRVRISRTKMFIVRLARSSREVRPAVDLLSAAQDNAPEAVARLFAYPWVGVWAAQSARGPVTELARQYLSGLAVAATAYSDLAVSGRAVLRVVGDLAIVPSLGAVLPGSSFPTSPPDLKGLRWQPIRRISATHCGKRVTVTVDDVDPYRRSHRMPTSERLTEDELAAWQDVLTSAWRMLVELAPTRSVELSAGLASLAPLASASGGLSLSSTHREAFGGFAATLQRDPVYFAATLVHEFQHTKLNALMNIVPLYDLEHTKRYFAPWRSDPRPVGGLLHGLYAFTAMADLWHAFRATPEIALAERNFAFARAQVSRAVADLISSPGLTEDGRRFVAGVAETITDLMRHYVSDDLQTQAEAQVWTAEREWRQQYG